MQIANPNSKIVVKAEAKSHNIKAMNLFANISSNKYLHINWYSYLTIDSRFSSCVHYVFFAIMNRK